MESPFQYGTLVTDAYFVNRVKERKELKTHLSSGINVMLVSPRRWGKSSLVKESMKELVQETNNIKVCYLDATTILSEENFYESFAREVIKSCENRVELWIDAVKKYLGSISPRIMIGPDPMTDFSLGFDLKALKSNELDVLNLPERIAQKKGIRIIICVDEFQDFANLKTYKSLEAKMRSVWQKQSNVSYCLYGSKRHMMLDIFNSSSNPFYRFGQMMYLDKIATDDWCNFIVKRFNDTGKTISRDLARYLTCLVSNHSWYVQQLSHFVWMDTEVTATKESIDDSLQYILNTNKPLYQSECDNLTSSQISLLKAIASGEKELTSVETMRNYNLGTPQNVLKNKKILLNKDYIEKKDKTFVFVDTVFEKWFTSYYID